MLGMSEEMKRLEKVLLEFLEETIKEPTPETIALIPSVAHELNELWKI